MDKIRVFVATPTTGTVADAQVWFWRETERLYGDRIEFIWPEACVRRVFHDFARNALVEEFLASKADILFFLDSDVVPPSSIMDLVLQHETWQAAGAPYPVFMTPGGHSLPQVVFTAYKGAKDGKGLGASDVPSRGTEFIDGLATGCMFLKREVFAQLQKPYFEFKYNNETRQMTEGEDLGFCMKLNKLGIKFFVDYEKVAKHYKNVCLLEISNYTQQYAKRSVEQYDAMIRPQLELLKQAIARKGQALVQPAPHPLLVTGKGQSKTK